MDDAQASCLYSAVRRQKGKVAGEPRIARNSSSRSRPDGREMFGERVRARVFSRQALTSTAYEAVSAEGPRREATWSRRNPVHIPEPGTGTVPICGRIPIPLGIRVLASESGTEFVGVTQQNPETPSGDPERVFFSL
ncbi:hypothetical protein Phum_PHUM351810 [Pediculus humanus corporis]|uniref:Uncharacterized protein n=1 Tax=Pediculus humanus subsp. corporis TaxID=121224 RepID=E0VP54_PEDHC|nr:hypothetical protein Phum_PHUM351810 [Pediculus humanus corporis]